MLRWGRRFHGILMSAALAGAPATADVLVTRAGESRGLFAGFEDNQFLFQSGDGEPARHPRGNVESLQLDRPRQVRMFRAGKNTPEAATLHGYRQLKFAVEQNGARHEVAGMQVRKLEVPMSPSAGRGGGADVPGPRPALDIAALERDGGLTPVQKEALGRYRRARQEYDAFVARSSAMVTEMENATGKKREALLNALRLRKNEEQPVTRRLELAEAALLAAVPPSRAGGGGPAARGDPLPAPAGDQVLLLDVAGLEQLPGLSQAQDDSLRRYIAAKTGYLRLAALDPGAVKPGDMEAAMKDLRNSQDALLQSFPDVKFAAGGAAR